MNDWWSIEITYCIKTLILGGLGEEASAMKIHIEHYVNISIEILTVKASEMGASEWGQRWERLPDTDQSRGREGEIERKTEDVSGKGAVIKAGDEGDAANWEMKEEEVKGNSSTFQIRWTWLLCAHSGFIISRS